MATSHNTADGANHHHGVNAFGRPNYPYRRHLWQALLFTLIAICAAVGLGMDDWYVREVSTVDPIYYNPQFTTTAIPNFNTFYYGLRKGANCFYPAGAFPGASNVPPGGNNQQGYAYQCHAFTYDAQSQYHAYLVNTNPAAVNGGGINGDNYNYAQDGYDAYQHLQGASGVILALLALLLIIALIGVWINLNHAFRVGWKSHRISSPLLFILCMILELLVIIFWITIFPYRFFYRMELLLAFGSLANINSQFNTPGSWATYYTIGTGFAIQIAGFIIATAAIFAFRGQPADYNYEMRPAAVYAPPATAIAVPIAQPAVVAYPVAQPAVVTSSPVIVSHTVPVTTYAGETAV